MTTTGRAGDCTSARRVSARRVSDAGMTSWMAGGERVRRYWRATERGYGHESHECFMKHVSLVLYLKQKILS